MVRRKNTEPERALRSALRRLGIRFRLHDRHLPGSPDIVIPGSRIAVFVHGCFWHRHKGCTRATSPKSNVRFWTEKFEANMMRDAKVARELKAAGWHVFVVWECQIKADAIKPAERIAARHRLREAVIGVQRKAKVQKVIRARASLPRAGDVPPLLSSGQV